MKNKFFDFAVTPKNTPENFYLHMSEGEVQECSIFKEGDFLVVGHSFGALIKTYKVLEAYSEEDNGYIRTLKVDDEECRQNPTELDIKLECNGIDGLTLLSSNIKNFHNKLNQFKGEVFVGDAAHSFFMDDFGREVTGNMVTLTPSMGVRMCMDILNKESESKYYTGEKDVISVFPGQLIATREGSTDKYEFVQSVDSLAYTYVTREVTPEFLSQEFPDLNIAEEIKAALDEQEKILSVTEY